MPEQSGAGGERKLSSEVIGVHITEDLENQMRTLGSDWNIFVIGVSGS